MKDSIIQQALRVAYDQTHDHQCLTDNSIVSQAIKRQTKFNQEDKREQKATLSLEAYDLYIFLPLWQQVTKKFIENA